MPRIAVGLASLLPLAGCAIAPVEDGAVAPRVAARISAALERHYPGARVEDVRRSGIGGLFEVYTGDGIVYADASGDYVLLGNLVDARTRQSLTAQRLDARRSIDYTALPFDAAIPVVRGDGSRQFAVFADPDCPFCHKLEQELRDLTDVTIHVFLYPLADLHPDAHAKARRIWCAADRGAAWTHWMLDRRLPPDADCDDDPLTRLAELGRSLRIDRTPTLFLADGRRLAGALTRSQLEAALASRPQARAAATALAAPAR